MAVSLISVDLDGTLLLPDKTISPRTVAAAKAAMAAGARFVINSGRMPESIRAAAEALHINAPVICFNGALTYDWDKQAECAAIPLDGLTARAIARRIESLGVYYQAFWGDRYYYREFTKYSDFYARKAAVTGQATGGTLSDKIPDSGVYKLLMIGEIGQAQAAARTMEEDFRGQADFLASSDTFLEIVNARASKGKALLHLAKSLSVPPSDILSFGDEQNDLDMLLVSGYGYAMENAVPSVRQQARFLAPSNTEDGVARVIETFLEKGEISAPGGNV